jgi:hypothetical protein
MAEIVARTGTMVESLSTLFYRKEKHEKTVVDIGVLRFPDIEHPYFKVRPYHAPDVDPDSLTCFVDISD